MINAKLRYALANRPDIPRISKGKTTNPDVDAGLGTAVAEFREPLGVLGSLVDVKHAATVSRGIQGRLWPCRDYLATARSLLGRCDQSETTGGLVRPTERRLCAAK
jgi:hypothetical protein